MPRILLDAGCTSFTLQNWFLSLRYKMTRNNLLRWPIIFMLSHALLFLLSKSDIEKSRPYKKMVPQFLFNLKKPSELSYFVQPTKYTMRIRNGDFQFSNIIKIRKMICTRLAGVYCALHFTRLSWAISWGTHQFNTAASAFVVRIKATLQFCRGFL